VKIILSTLTFVFVFFIVEHVLEHLGHRPGVLMNYGNFNASDTLRTYTLYTDDEAGIYRLGPYVTDTMAAAYTGDQIDLPRNVFADGLRITEGVDVVLRDFRIISNGIDSALVKEDQDVCELMANKGEFALAACRSIMAGDADSAMYRDYLWNPFNFEGFRSINLSHRPEGRPRVMLVGDSFVWGMSAEPVYNSYSDILLARGFTVYNMGIIGTDPAQYEAIVRKYVPLLRPDMVIVNVFLGNDLMPFERDVRSGMPPEHLTSSGFLDSHPLGQYLPPQEAYEFYMAFNRIPDLETRWFNRFCSRSNVLTKIWLLLYELGLAKHQIRSSYDRLHGMPDTAKAQVTSKHLRGIRETCRAYGVPLVNTVIPEKPFTLFRNRPFRTGNRELDLFRILYGGEDYHCPENLCVNDFEDHGVHFNNAGSLKYADFLEKIINDRHGSKIFSIRPCESRPPATVYSWFSVPPSITIGARKSTDLVRIRGRN
jgi:hypothetical protein